MKNRVRFAAALACVVLLGCLAARVHHLRSVHITPAQAVCGGELLPCSALAGARAHSDAYDPCWEAEQPPKRSAKPHEDAELALLHRLDEAHCAVLVRVRAMTRIAVNARPSYLGH